jgi:hypothetical protein
MRVHPASSSWLVAVSGQARDRDRREPKMGRVGRGFKSLARLPARPGNHRATLLSSFELGAPLSLVVRASPDGFSLAKGAFAEHLLPFETSTRHGRNGIGGRELSGFRRSTLR